MINILFFLSESFCILLYFNKLRFIRSNCKTAIINFIKKGHFRIFFSFVSLFGSPLTFKYNKCFLIYLPCHYAQKAHRPFLIPNSSINLSNKGLSKMLSVKTQKQQQKTRETIKTPQFKKQTNLNLTIQLKIVMLNVYGRGLNSTPFLH